jgi:uncharacterized protein (TIGR02453 family)
MSAAGRFSFPADTVEFLADLRRHNDKGWFDAHRDRYEAAYVEPAKAFVEAAAPRLATIVPGITAEPRVLGSIFRIHRDTRFSTDKRPYKDHLDFWFWQGERKTAVSGLFLRVSPDVVIVGAGAHGFDKDQLARYRAAVAGPVSGGDLRATVAKVERAGFEIGGRTYTRPPRGFTADGPTTERLLRHSALFAHGELPAPWATTPGFLSEALRRWRTFAPVHRWLYDMPGSGTPAELLAAAGIDANAIVACARELATQTHDE